MKTCKNCYYWKTHTWGLCVLTNVGVGELWRCEKWEPQRTSASNNDTYVNKNDLLSQEMS